MKFASSGFEFIKWVRDLHNTPNFLSYSFSLPHIEVHLPKIHRQATNFVLSLPGINGFSLNDKKV